MTAKRIEYKNRVKTSYKIYVKNYQTVRKVARDTDSVYIHNNDYNMLIEKGLVGEDLSRSKNDYGENAGNFYGLFSAPKIKYCIAENGVLSQKTTFRGFNKSINNIISKDFLDLEQGKTLKNI